MNTSLTSVSRFRVSKLLLIISAFLAFPAVIETRAQTPEVRISVLSLAPAKVKVELTHRAGNTWSFRNTFSKIVGLADRIENLQGADARGQNVSVRRLASGEYRSSERLSRIRYEVLLTLPSRPSDMSHVSWLGEDHGVLMLGDLLPQLENKGHNTESLITNFDLPAGWTSASSIASLKRDQYLVEDPERAVFLIGRSLRERKTSVELTQIRLLTPAKWGFSDDDALKIAAKLLGEYARVSQHPLQTNAALLLVPFPGVVGPDRWTAETRGSNVVLVVGNRASREALLGRLRVVLAHELFHLWVPNALSLDGDYDWFFEGFTLYQALLTGVRLRNNSFEDYLETLGRVYDSYRSSPERDKLSLIEASERRWTSSSSLVYDKGMLVAFIYDLLIRRASGGAEMVTNVYPKLFSAANGDRREANDLIMSILNSPNGMSGFAGQYIENAGEIELARVLAPFGLDVETTGSITQITVNRKINSEQRRLLKSLGY